MLIDSGWQQRDSTGCGLEEVWWWAGIDDFIGVGSSLDGLGGYEFIMFGWYVLVLAIICCFLAVFAPLLFFIWIF